VPEAHRNLNSDAERAATAGLRRYVDSTTNKTTSVTASLLELDWGLACTLPSPADQMCAGKQWHVRRTAVRARDNACFHRCKVSTMSLMKCSWHVFANNMNFWLEAVCLQPLFKPSTIIMVDIRCIILLALASSVSCQNYSTSGPLSINPDSVDYDTRLAWCRAQTTTCPQICSGTDSVNTCDAVGEADTSVRQPSSSDETRVEHSGLYLRLYLRPTTKHLRLRSDYPVIRLRAMADQLRGSTSS